MSPIAFAVAVSAAFAAGIVLHKYVISEAAAIKQHVTEEIAELRVDAAFLRANGRSEIGKIISDVKAWSEKESASAKDVLDQVDARLRQIF